MAQFSIISRAWTTKMNEIYAKKHKLLRKVTKTLSTRTLVVDICEV